MDSWTKSEKYQALMVLWLILLQTTASGWAAIGFLIIATVNGVLSSYHAFKEHRENQQ